MCVCVCVCVHVCVCLCARARVSVCARTLKHSLSDGQRKTANDNYNQHLKAKALRDTYNANIEKAQGRIQDFVLGGGGGAWGRAPPNLPGCLGKRSKHHHHRPKTLATGVLFYTFGNYKTCMYSRIQMIKDTYKSITVTLHK